MLCFVLTLTTGWLSFASLPDFSGNVPAVLLKGACYIFLGQVAADRGNETTSEQLPPEALARLRAISEAFDAFSVHFSTDINWSTPQPAGSRPIGRKHSFYAEGNRFLSREERTLASQKGRSARLPTSFLTTEKCFTMGSSKIMQSQQPC